MRRVAADDPKTFDPATQKRGKHCPVYAFAFICDKIGLVNENLDSTVSNRHVTNGTGF
jgi:hypothetical protein